MVFQLASVVPKCPFSCDLTRRDIANLLVLPRFATSVTMFSRTRFFPVRKRRTRKFWLGVPLQKHLIDVLSGSATIQSAEIVSLGGCRRHV